MIKCNGCRQCCLKEQVKLLPEMGDDLSKYVTVETIDGTYIAKGKGDACRYLGERGCTIYPERPFSCRAFDCRVYALHYLGKMDRAQRRQFLRGNPIAEVFKVGMRKAAEDGWT